MMTVFCVLLLLVLAPSHQNFAFKILFAWYSVQEHSPLNNLLIKLRNFILNNKDMSALDVSPFTVVFSESNNTWMFPSTYWDTCWICMYFLYLGHGLSQPGTALTLSCLKTHCNMIFFKVVATSLQLHAQLMNNFYHRHKYDCHHNSNETICDFIFLWDWPQNLIKEKLIGG